MTPLTLPITSSPLKTIAYLSPLTTTIKTTNNFGGIALKDVGVQIGLIVRLEELWSVSEKNVKTTLWLSEDHYRHAMELIERGVAGS